MYKANSVLYSIAIIALNIMYSLVLLTPLRASAEQLTWLDKTQPPTIKTADTISGTEFNTLRQQQSGFARQECIQKKIAIQTLPLTYHDGCWYATSIGMLEQGGKYLLEPGEKVAAYIKNEANSTVKLYPTPSPNVFAETVNDAGTGYGYFVTLRSANDIKFQRDNSSSGRINLIHQTNGTRIKSAKGLLHTESSYIWYSSNTKWMLILSEAGDFVKVNLETLELSLIKFRDKPSGSWIPGMADITNDGRYVAASINGATSYSELYLVDTQNCDELSTPGTYTKCQQRTLKSSIQQTVTPYRKIGLPRFYSNHTLGFYHENSNATYTQYLLQAPHTTAVTSNYLALGDSFASGEGAFEYEIGTDVANQNMCHLSRRSYPYLIQKQVALQGFQSVACSGAKIEDITHKSQAKKPSHNPMGDLVPGYQKQLQYIHDAQQKPTIITISIAGNNIGFADKIQHCVLSINSCFSSWEDRQEIMNEIDDQLSKLTKMYQEIKNSVSPDAKIYAIGYPQIISDTTTAQCGINVRLTAEERQLASLVTRYLNNTLMQAAQQAEVQYIDVDDALAGNRLCETSSAAMAVNGITAGKDAGIGDYKFIGKESFHPNEKGHQLLKDAILNKTKGFTHNSSVITGNKQVIKDTLLQAPEAHRIIRTKIHSDTLTNQQTLPGSTVSLSGDAFQYNLPPNNKLDITLDDYSDILGSVITDNNGSIQTTITIPTDVEPGIQAIHIYGKDNTGKDIDIYQYIQIPHKNEEIEVLPPDTHPDIPISDKTPRDAIPPQHSSSSALLNFSLTPTLPHIDSVTAPLGEQPYAASSTPHTLSATNQKLRHVGSTTPKLDLSKDEGLAKKVAIITVASIATSLLVMLVTYKLAVTLYIKFK